jgi:integrase/recombinase XerD
MQASDAAQRSVARRLAGVSSWYRYLVADGLRADSPVENVRRPKIGDLGETPGLTRDELRRLLAAAKEHGRARSFALLSLLAHMGLRIKSGQAGADLEHVDRLPAMPRDGPHAALAQKRLDSLRISSFRLG